MEDSKELSQISPDANEKTPFNLFLQTFGVFLLFFFGNVLVFTAVAFAGFLLFAVISSTFKYGVVALPVIFISSCAACWWLYRVLIKVWKRKVMPEENLGFRISRMVATYLSIAIYLLLWLSFMGS